MHLSITRGTATDIPCLVETTHPLDGWVETRSSAEVLDDTGDSDSGSVTDPVELMHLRRQTILPSPDYAPSPRGPLLRSQPPRSFMRQPI